MIRTLNLKKIKKFFFSLFFLNIWRFCSQNKHARLYSHDVIELMN